MVQGTGSHVGKSVLVTGLCRIFRQQGYRVAPFKAQNMALNSFVTEEGGEMGRAQVVQAEAAGIKPSVHMNPVLIKPQTDCGAQLIIQGKVVGNYSALAYHRYKREAFKAVQESYARLALLYDLIVIEGAGSPVEVNLRKNDIVNMRIARMARAPVLMVSDIDRGGVFASLVGTMELLAPSDRRRVKGFIINKFRGDPALLRSGLTFLRRKTGVKVLGVIPLFQNIFIPDEDSVSLENKGSKKADGGVDIAVIKLPHISNFTDFDPLEGEDALTVRYVERVDELNNSEVIIIPGSKNSIEDLDYLITRGFGEAIVKRKAQGSMIIGLCGGFQMLGKTIRDPYRVESTRREIAGLGLLDMETRFSRRKATFQVEAEELHPQEGTCSPERLRGYEIHMGRTRLHGEKNLFIIRSRSGKSCAHHDGAVSHDGRVWGTYIHGIFDNDGFRRRLIERMRRGPCHRAETSPPFCYGAFREDQLDRLADLIRQRLDMDSITQLIA